MCFDVDFSGVFIDLLKWLYISNTSCTRGEKMQVTKVIGIGLTYDEIPDELCFISFPTFK